MRVEGTYRFPAPPERVYALLLDPTVLAGCIPGCERLEAVGPDQYEATVKNASARDPEDFPEGAQLCAKCHTKAAIQMDGCLTCLNCGESKCG